MAKKSIIKEENLAVPSFKKKKKDFFLGICGIGMSIF